MFFGCKFLAVLMKKFWILEHHQVQICTTMMSSSAVDVSDIDFTKNQLWYLGQKAQD
jgi:hypothetical protein